MLARRCVPGLAPKRTPPSLSVSFTSVREAIHAGTRPNASSAAALIAAENPKIRRSRRSEEHTSELQSRLHLVCRLLLEKKKKSNITDGGSKSIVRHESECR